MIFALNEQVLLLTWWVSPRIKVWCCDYVLVMVIFLERKYESPSGLFPDHDYGQFWDGCRQTSVPESTIYTVRIGVTAFLITQTAPPKQIVLRGVILKQNRECDQGTESIVESKHWKHRWDGCIGIRKLRSDRRLHMYVQNRCLSNMNAFLYQWC